MIPEAAVSGGEPHHTRGRRGPADRPVVRLDRHRHPDLAVVEQHAGERADRDPAQGPVVGAAAAAEPDARRRRPPGRGRARRRRSRPRPARAARPAGSSSPRPAGTSRRRPVVRRPVEVVVGQQHRQDHPLAGGRAARRAAGRCRARRRPRRTPRRSPPGVPPERRAGAPRSPARQSDRPRPADAAGGRSAAGPAAAIFGGWLDAGHAGSLRS